MVAACACGLNVGHVCEGLPQTCDCTTRAPSLAEKTPIYYILYTHIQIFPIFVTIFVTFFFLLFLVLPNIIIKQEVTLLLTFMRKVSFFFGSCFCAHFQCREARCAFTVQFLQKKTQHHSQDWTETFHHTVYGTLIYNIIINCNNPVP